MNTENKNTKVAADDGCDGKLKILQVAKWCSPYIGGIERIVEDIVESLKQRTKMMLLVCADGKKTTFETRDDGVEVVRAGSIAKLCSMPISIKYLDWFRKLSTDADVIQFHAPFPLSDLALFLFHHNRAATAVWWHSDVVRQKKLLMFYKPLMNWFLEHVDRIYVASDAIVHQSEHLGKYIDKIEVIPFGIDERIYKDSSSLKPILTKKLIDKKNKKILFVGRLVYYKGVEVLIDAFEGIEGAELFIVGEGELRKTLEGVAKCSEQSDRIHFIGSLSEAELQAAYNDCDIFVLPSISRSECFGLVQMEAMAYGKPVINTRLDTAVPEVSLDGVSGITVTPESVEELHDAIEKLCKDDKLRKLYGKAAKKRIHQHFSLEAMGDKLFSSYSELHERKLREKELENETEKVKYGDKILRTDNGDSVSV